MAIFDSNKKRYLTFYIVLDDAAEVAALQAQYPNGINCAIREPVTAEFPFGISRQPNGGVSAEVFYGAPFRGYTDPAGAAPYIWTPWYSANPADPGSKPFPLNDRRFSRHSGGFLGIGGTTITYYWIGQFMLAGSALPALPGTGRIARRWWIEGWSLPFSGPTSSGDGGMSISRDAARHVGGYGLAQRGATALTGGIFWDTHDAAGANVFKAWERFYIRVRKRPSSESVGFYQMSMDGNDGNSGGVRLEITPAGTISVIHRRFGSSVNVGTLATIPEEWTGRSDHNAWVRIDLLMNMAGNGNPATPGRLRVYVRGASELDFTAPSGSGLGTGNGCVDFSQYGNALGNANDMEMDIADCHAANIPEDGGGAEDLTSLDFVLGSKIVKLLPNAIGAATANWTGDFRIARQIPNTTTTQNGEQYLTSNTALSLLELECNNDVVTKDPGIMSVDAFTCIQIHKSGLRAGVADGTMGYRLGANAAVDVAISDNTVKNHDRVLYTVPGTATTFPAGNTPIRLRLTKANSADLQSVLTLAAQVQLVGRWGKEDHRLADQGGVELSVYRRDVGPHNAPYPLSPWATGSQIANASAPVIFQTGTYVGNGTGQDLVFRAPVLMLMIRTASPSTDIWFNSADVIRRHGTGTGSTPGPQDAEEDVTFVPGSGEDTQMQRYMVRIGGAYARINQNAVTYRYLAIMDPGARFFLNITPAGAAGLTQVVKLPNATFTPEAALVWRGSISGSPGLACFIKAIGQADAARLNVFGGSSAITPGLTLGTGEITLGTAFNNVGYSQNPMTLMRRSDGNGDTNEAAVLDCGTYVGDGSGSRTLTVGTAGRRPLYAMIAPSNTGNGVYRDPGHTTNTSSTQTGASTTLGITGGIIDGFTVASAMNVNGVEYTWFVLWGGTTAGNGGWSEDGEFIPVEPDMPSDGDGDIPDESVYEEPEPPSPTLPGEPDLDEADDILTPDDNIGGTAGGQPCEAYTRELVNIALSHLEISKQVGNLVTENSEAAALARRHVRNDVNTVLRDFPWDFATAYQELVLVAGSEAAPVNQDWIYSYRAPNAMMFARRIVTLNKGRKFDPDPIPFRLDRDTSGLLVYCNSLATATVPLVLEYTIRNECPAFWGDAIFREALTWKFASSLSSLTKDPKKKAFCLGVYRDILERARTVDAKEQQQEHPGDADWISGRN